MCEIGSVYEETLNVSAEPIWIHRKHNTTVENNSIADIWLFLAAPPPSSHW